MIKINDQNFNSVWFLRYLDKDLHNSSPTDTTFWYIVISYGKPLDFKIKIIGTLAILLTHYWGLSSVLSLFLLSVYLCFIISLFDWRGLINVHDHIK